MLHNHNANQTDIIGALGLNLYAPISLAKMTNVALQNRTDTKFVLAAADLVEILPHLSDAYAVLAVNGRRLNPYRTLYFDSGAFELYHRHHAGALDRYKVRAREYVGSELAFLEVKHKTNKGRTIKSRLKTPKLAVSLTGEGADFLRSAYPYDVAALAPKLWVEYSRITLVSHQRKERVTIDLDLSYTWGGQTRTVPGVVIVEIKQAGFSHLSDIGLQLRKHQIRATGFSKYCVGISLLYPEVKQNNFKSKLRAIEKYAEGFSNVYLN